MGEDWHPDLPPQVVERVVDEPGRRAEGQLANLPADLRRGAPNGQDGDRAVVFQSAAVGGRFRVAERRHRWVASQPSSRDVTPNTRAASWAGGSAVYMRALRNTSVSPNTWTRCPPAGWTVSSGTSTQNGRPGAAAVSPARRRAAVSASSAKRGPTLCPSADRRSTP